MPERIRLGSANTLFIRLPSPHMSILIKSSNAFSWRHNFLAGDWPLPGLPGEPRPQREGPPGVAPLLRPLPVHVPPVRRRNKGADIPDEVSSTSSRGQTETYQDSFHGGFSGKPFNDFRQGESKNREGCSQHQKSLSKCTEEREGRYMNINSLHSLEAVFDPLPLKHLFSFLEGTLSKGLSATTFPGFLPRPLLFLSARFFSSKSFLGFPE